MKGKTHGPPSLGEWPVDGLEDSWFDRPSQRLQLPTLDRETPDLDRTDDLDDPWFV